MKIYELLSVLSEFPAGAEVIASYTMTVDELASGDVLGANNGKPIYSFTKGVCDIGDATEKRVYLNLEV